MAKYAAYPVRIESTGEIRLFYFNYDPSDVLIEDKILDEIFEKLENEGDYTVLDLFYSDAGTPEMVAEDYFAEEVKNHIRRIYRVEDIQQPEKYVILFDFNGRLYTVKLIHIGYAWLDGKIYDYAYEIYSFENGLQHKEIATDGLFMGFDFSIIQDIVLGEFDVEIPKLKEGGIIAPNGKPSNLTPEQYRLVRTPEFKAFFGDWENDPQNASKVVDENGEPMVVYHGGTKGINVFENKKGIYFTPFRNIADDFLKYRSGENGKIYDVFLKIKHPKTYDVINYNDIPKSESELNDNDGIIAEYVALEDGTNEGKQFVVFDSNQIKLADGTNTTFDSSNPDIRFADGGEIKEDNIIETLRNTKYIETGETRIDEDYDPDDAEYNQRLVYKPVYVLDYYYADNTDPYNIGEYDNIDEALSELDEQPSYNESDRYYEPYNELRFYVREIWLDSNNNEVEEGDLISDIYDLNNKIENDIINNFAIDNTIERYFFKKREESAEELEMEVQQYLKDVYDRSIGSYNDIILGYKDEENDDAVTMQIRVKDHSENPSNKQKSVADTFLSIVIANKNETAQRFHSSTELYFTGDNTLDEVRDSVFNYIQDVLFRYDVAYLDENLIKEGHTASGVNTFNNGGSVDNNSSYTIAKHRDTEKRTYDGEITIDEFKNAFESALKSEEALKAELEPLKKDELLKLGGSGMFYSRYKNERKDRIIEALVDDIITFFALGSYSYTFGQDRHEGVKQKVASLTQKSLDDYAAEVAEARRQSQERREKIKAILDNPQTLADFNTFLEYRKKESMTPEQAKLYDELVAQNTKERQEKQAEQKAVVKKVEIGAGVDMNIYETKHTKTGQPLYVVKLSERVDHETYKELNRRAKQLGGYYSSYTRDGAIAGFQFKEKEQAEKFASLKEGDVSNVEKIEERKEEKAGKRADKLRKNAEAIIERVDEELNKDRLTNTAKRAAQATSTESRLHGEKAIAKTMINIADAIDSGQAKYLDLVRTKAQIEQLDAIVKSGHSIYIREKYPDYSSYESHKYDPITEEAVNHIHPMYLFFPRLYTEHWIRAIDKNEDRSGLKNISAKIRKYLGNSEYYQIKNKYELNDFLEFADKIPDSWETNRLKEFAKEHKRLESLGIESDEMLRALLREFILYRGGVEKIDRAKELERKLAGRKVGIDFFPTPKSLAIKMVRMAEVEEGMSILEPSAGNGNIADAIREETGITPDVCEISSELAAILEAKGYTVVATDFMELTEKKYDRIIMNPPFSSRMDAAHVKHAYELLNPNGRIVSIMGEGVFFGSDNAAVSFRDWIDEINGEVEKLPESTFTDKTLYATTGANARLVIINKPAEFGETEPEKEEEKQPETPEIPIPEYEPSLETEIVPEAEITPEPEPIPETKPDVKPEPSAEIPLEERKKQFLEQAMKIINEIPVEKMKEMYNSAMGELLKGEQDKLDNVLSQIAENNDYIEKSRIEEKDKVDREKYALMEKRSLTHAKNKILKSAEIFYTNNVNAIINGGSLLSVTDKLGKESVVADYTKINTADITFTQETILSEERPIYVPVIDEDVFASKGYVFDAIRIGKDNYIMAVNGYKYARSQSRDEILTLSDSEENGFVMLTLDQLVLTNLYYIEKAKAIFQKQADERNADAERRFDNSSDAYKERFLMQKGIYHSLPAKIKKTITQEEYEKLGWQDRVKIDKFLTKRRPKQIVSRLSEDSMWASFHFMYNRFLNPAAIQPAARVANSEVWAYWASFRDFMNFKIKDIQIQREDLSEIRKTALETSFGMSNTNESLKAKYGILVKHQDGSKITPDSITQISVSIHNIYSVFANLKAKAIADTMKVSHTQQRYIFASKAIGVYIPQFATMACSGKFGETEFQCTLAHETAHWIDNLLGRINGKRYATDDYESLAGEIAFGFRKHMNVKSENDYINATKECFARALQQYFAVTVFGDDVETIYSYNLLHNPTPYFTQDNFVGKNYFYSTMKPMIEDFLKENKPLLEENLITDDIDNAPEIEPTIEETKVQEEADEKANRMRMLALKAKADADALALLELEMEMQSGG